AAGIGLRVLLLVWAAVTLWNVPLPGAPWATDPLDKLGYLLDELGPALLCLVAPALLAGLAGLVGLAVRAVRKGELPLGLALLLLVGYGLLLAILIVALIAADVDEPPIVAIVAFAVAYLAIP